MFRNFIASITRNALSLAGTALALAALVLIISLFFVEKLGYEGGPYLGILTYLILPAIFILGLLLIPIGSLLYRRKLRKQPGSEDVPALPVFDFNNERTRRWQASQTTQLHPHEPMFVQPFSGWLTYAEASVNKAKKTALSNAPRMMSRLRIKITIDDSIFMNHSIKSLQRR